MKDWNADLYSRFEAERTLPSRDLISRLKDAHPSTIIDLGSGPGNSTRLLHAAFPEARLIGLDSSPAMIAKAHSAGDGIDYRLGDLTKLKGTYDLIFSNACLQWVPDHEHLIPSLFGQVNEGGTLAVQVPSNEDAPLYQALRNVAGRWGLTSGGNAFHTLDVRNYARLLAKLSDDWQVWTVTYQHHMPSHESLIDWIRATRLRPYEAEMDDKTRFQFEQDILQEIATSYPEEPFGGVLFAFRRLFFTVKKA